MIIALQGRPGCGKSTAASYLVQQHNFTLHKIAKPLKDMLRGFGLTERHIEGDLKRVPCKLLAGKTPTYGMQTLGKEWRDLFSPDLFLYSWLENKPSGDLVLDDNRYPNEITFLREHCDDVVFLQIIRPGLEVGEYESHAAERQTLEHDAVVVNDGTPDQLGRRVLEFARMVIDARHNGNKPHQAR